MKEKFPEVEYDPISVFLKIEKKDRSVLVRSQCVRREQQIFRLLRKLHRQRNILVQMLNGFMMWESAECIVCFQTGDDSECELCSCSCGNGGSSCQCDGRSGEQTG